MNKINRQVEMIFAWVLYLKFQWTTCCMGLATLDCFEAGV